MKQGFTLKAGWKPNRCVTFIGAFWSRGEIIIGLI
jgi:hypothetical protein